PVSHSCPSPASAWITDTDSLQGEYVCECTTSFSFWPPHVFAHMSVMPGAWHSACVCVCVCVCVWVCVWVCLWSEGLILGCPRMPCCLAGYVLVCFVSGSLCLCLCVCVCVRECE